MPCRSRAGLVMLIKYCAFSLPYVDQRVSLPAKKLRLLQQMDPNSWENALRSNLLADRASGTPCLATIAPCLVPGALPTACRYQAFRAILAGRSEKVHLHSSGHLAYRSPAPICHLLPWSRDRIFVISSVQLACFLA